MKPSRAPKKRYGQHFLTSPAYAEKIADAVGADRDAPVLEIGPGRGALTRHLRQRYDNLHCLEVDPDVIPELIEKVGDEGWTLHRGSALDFDYLSIGAPLHVVGNLPYNIGALIIKKTLLYGTDITSCTFMVQREVAERISAAPGSKRNGFLSIFCQYFGAPSILFHVPPGAFFPRPNVDSSVFHLTIDTAKVARLARERWDQFFALVDRGFSMRRKMLVNVLGHNGNREGYREAVERAGLAPGVRPEQLGVEEWLRLFHEVEAGL